MISVDFELDQNFVTLSVSALRIFYFSASAELRFGAFLGAPTEKCCSRYNIWDAPNLSFI